jgi:hypothetical protein
MSAAHQMHERSGLAASRRAASAALFALSLQVREQKVEGRRCFG